jgi:hypothetical protein
MSGIYLISHHEESVPFVRRAPDKHICMQLRVMEGYDWTTCCFNKCLVHSSQVEELASGLSEMDLFYFSTMLLSLYSKAFLSLLFSSIDIPFQFSLLSFAYSPLRLACLSSHLFTSGFLLCLII